MSSDAYVSLQGKWKWGTMVHFKWLVSKIIVGLLLGPPGGVLSPLGCHVGIQVTKQISAYCIL